MIVPKRGAEARGGSEGRKRRAKHNIVRFYIVICNVM
jgi:hypothetical protein